MRCTYCDSDLAPYEPVHVSEGSGDDRAGVGAFCNYACLVSYIDAEGLTVGNACEWGPA